MQIHLSPLALLRLASMVVSYLPQLSSSGQQAYCGKIKIIFSCLLECRYPADGLWFFLGISAPFFPHLLPSFCIRSFQNNPALHASRCSRLVSSSKQGLPGLGCEKAGGLWMVIGTFYLHVCLDSFSPPAIGTLMVLHIAVIVLSKPWSKNKLANYHYKVEVDFTDQIQSNFIILAISLCHFILLSDTSIFKYFFPHYLKETIYK